MAAGTFRDAADDPTSVLDEENYVDRRRKEDILRLRRQVDDHESELFLAVAQGRLGEDEATSLWHGAVRRFLMSFEPLLQNSEIPGAEEYYLQERLGTVHLEPPEKYTGGNGNLFHDETPEPKYVAVHGLKSVIDQEVFSATWEVRIDKARSDGFTGGKPVETETFENTTIMPREILRNAVRTGDMFLQNAGVGLEIGKGDYESQEPGL